MSRSRRTNSDKERGARLGRALQAARESEREPKSQREIADMARISLDTLRKIEQGRVSDPGVFKVAAIASVLDLSLDDLVKARKRARR